MLLCHTYNALFAAAKQFNGIVSKFFDVDDAKNGDDNTLNAVVDALCLAYKSLNAVVVTLSPVVTLLNACYMQLCHTYNALDAVDYTKSVVDDAKSGIDK